MFKTEDVEEVDFSTRPFVVRSPFRTVKAQTVIIATGAEWDEWHFFLPSVVFGLFSKNDDLVLRGAGVVTDVGADAFSGGLRSGCVDSCGSCILTALELFLANLTALLCFVQHSTLGFPMAFAFVLCLLLSLILCNNS